MTETVTAVLARDGRAVVLTEPDEDGDHGWSCSACGAEAESVQPIADAIEHATTHLTDRCPKRGTS